MNNIKSAISGLRQFLATAFNAFHKALKAVAKALFVLNIFKFSF